jgi:hypothetical protein
MADALALGASDRKVMEVQVLSPAPKISILCWDFLVNSSDIRQVEFVEVGVWIAVLGGGADGD